MLKKRLITGAYLVVIFISIYVSLKIIWQPPAIPSAPTETAATTANSTPMILRVSTTPGPGSTPEPTPSASPTTAESTPTPTPLKSRVVKHQPNQFRKGALSKEELSAIKKAIGTIKWSRNSDPKAGAVEDYMTIVKECAHSTIHDLLADLITEAASNDYDPGNEAANSSYSTELISTFETNLKDEREVQKPRPKRR